MEEQQAPPPRKSRRYTAPPKTVSDSVVIGVFEMPHGAGRPDSQRPPAAPQPKAAQPQGIPGEASPDEELPDEATSVGQTQPPVPGKAAHAKTPGKAGSGPVLPERAAEDDPRRWGDTEEDLGEWMRSQRPPHWD